jgi:hypothetical protein
VTIPRSSPLSPVQNLGPALLMVLTAGQVTVDCDACNMHMSTGPDNSMTTTSEPVPVGRYVHLDGSVTELDTTADILTQYANGLCPNQDCPHRTTE